jgi:two-component system, NarL family, sensor histidine kinase DegS
MTPMSRMQSKSSVAPSAKPRTAAATARQLKREIERRETLQQALAQSERHYDHLLHKSAQMQDHLRRLSHEILSAQEEERKKISRELHDRVAQTLIAINVKLAVLRRDATVNIAGLKKTLAGTQRLLDQSLGAVHRFAREMRPPMLDDLGLTPALHSYAKEFTKRTRVPIHCTVSGGIDALDGEKQTVLYRVVQEALTNVAKHAKATRVNVTIKKLGKAVRLDVHDDGRAFRVESVLYPKKITRLGLLGMRERTEMVGGSFSIESEPGQGTTVRAVVPIGKVRRPSSGGSVELSR